MSESQEKMSKVVILPMWLDISDDDKGNVSIDAKQYGWDIFINSRDGLLTIGIGGHQVNLFRLGGRLHLGLYDHLNMVVERGRKEHPNILIDSDEYPTSLTVKETEHKWAGLNIFAQRPEAFMGVPRDKERREAVRELRLHELEMMIIGDDTPFEARYLAMQEFKKTMRGEA